MSAMKRRLSFLVAAMAATSAAPVCAQQDPGKMFMINAVTPGVVSFSGEGTAQFNNSSSTANAFSVGSSTNFGVNASASSTNDYMVDSNALLQLAGTSQLQQTLGTSASAANTMASAEAASKAAESVATQRVTESFGQNWKDYGARNGVDVTATGSVASSNLTYKTEAAYEAAKQSEFNKEMKEVYASVDTSSRSTTATGASANGIISGEFVTTNKSQTQIGATASSSANNSAVAKTAVEEVLGSNYSDSSSNTNDYMEKFTSFAGSDGKITTAGEIAAAKAAGLVWNETAATSGSTILAAGSALSQDQYNTTKATKIDEAFSALQKSSSSSGNASNESTATVTVTGVGSIATLNASSDSAFNVDVATRLRSSIPDTNGTANGSAGGNLATSSFANQSNSQTASAFMQAFGADTVKLNADSTGKLQTATINGRFDVTIDAAAGTTAGDTTLKDPVISVPK